MIMTRLPQPIIKTIEVTWPEDFKKREKSFHEILGQAIRKRTADEKRKEIKD